MFFRFEKTKANRRPGRTGAMGARREGTHQEARSPPKWRAFLFLGLSKALECLAWWVRMSLDVFSFRKNQGESPPRQDGRYGRPPRGDPSRGEEPAILAGFFIFGT